MNSGTSARCGSVRSICTGGSTRFPPQRDSPETRPRAAPTLTPSASPITTRTSETSRPSGSSPLAVTSTAATTTRQGEASSSSASRPVLEASCQITRTATGLIHRCQARDRLGRGDSDGVGVTARAGALDWRVDTRAPGDVPWRSGRRVSATGAVGGAHEVDVATPRQIPAPGSSLDRERRSVTTQPRCGVAPTCAIFPAIGGKITHGGVDGPPSLRPDGCLR